MNKLNHFLILFIFCSTIFSSCKKPEQDSQKIALAEEKTKQLVKIVKTYAISENKISINFEEIIKSGFIDKDELPSDPWGGTYKIHVDQDNISVSSYGPDQKEGNEDDIVAKTSLPQIKSTQISEQTQKNNLIENPDFSKWINIGKKDYWSVSMPENTKDISESIKTQMNEIQKNANEDEKTIDTLLYSAILSEEKTNIVISFNEFKKNFNILNENEKDLEYKDFTEKLTSQYQMTVEPLSKINDGIEFKANHASGAIMFGRLLMFDNSLLMIACVFQNPPISETQKKIKDHIFNSIVIQKKHNIEIKNVEITPFESCNNGDHNMCFNIAYNLKNEKKIENNETVLQLYWKACNGGIVDACATLGSMYLFGDGVLIDFEKAFQLNEKSCQEKSYFSCVNIGIQYEFGQGVGVNFERAAKFYQESCENNEISGCANWGNLLLYGKGIQKNEVLARDVLARACKEKNHYGCYMLARIYDEGRGVEPDFNIAQNLYSESCNNEILGACIGLAWMYDQEKIKGKSEKEIIALYKKSCDGGEWIGCTNMGTFFEDSVPAEAAKFYKLACDNKEALGCSNLGNLYREGHGVEMDLNRAKELYQIACDGGEREACKEF